MRWTAKRVLENKFDRLQPLRAEKRGERRGYWCRCDCGNELWVDHGNLTCERTKSCGCLTKDVAAAKSPVSVGMISGVWKIETKEASDGVHGRWKCVCIVCGNVEVKRTDNLVEAAKSPEPRCLCKGRHIDITGQTFHHLKVKGHAGFKIVGNDLSQKKTLWACDCKCGGFCLVEYGNLVNGHTKSCGCLVGEVAATRKFIGAYVGRREHRIWAGLKRRISDVNGKRWHRYGGRGITVCQGIDSSVVHFVSVVGDWPGKGYSIDRIDNDGGYWCGRCPECVRQGHPCNIRWATPEQQQRNTCRNHFITFGSETKTLAEWAEIKGWGVSTIAQRLNRGWSVDEALTKQPIDRERLLVFNGEEKSIAEWARCAGMSDQGFADRIERGWSMEKALTTPPKKDNLTNG